MHRFLFILIISTICQTQAYAASPGSYTATVTINGFTFEFKADTGLASSCEGEASIVTLTRIRDGKRTKLLSHVLESKMCDCNSVQLELGKWEIIGNSLVFYSLWARTGDAPAAPCAVRKQVYAVKENGTVALISSVMYFHEYGWVFNEGESHYFDEEDPESVKFFKMHYRSRFLEGKEGLALDKEVHFKLEKMLAQQTMAWSDPNRAGSSFGMCK
jgi:hypothetical protein